MADYILHTCEHGAFSPRTGKAANMTESEAQAHNAAQERAELAAWATMPDSFAVYLTPVNDNWRKETSPMVATTWRGIILSVGAVSVRRFRTNLSRNMVAIRFIGTNGAEYYGRYGADWSQLCRVRKVKARKIPTLESISGDPMTRAYGRS